MITTFFNRTVDSEEGIGFKEEASERCFFVMAVLKRKKSMKRFTGLSR